MGRVWASLKVPRSRVPYPEIKKVIRTIKEAVIASKVHSKLILSQDEIKPDKPCPQLDFALIYIKSHQVTLSTHQVRWTFC
jgi:hypothetical protein